MRTRSSIRYPSAALEPAAALLGWLSLAALGAAGLATKTRRAHDLGRVPMGCGVPRRRGREHPSRRPTAQRTRGAAPACRGSAQIPTGLGRRREGVVAPGRRVPVRSAGQDRQLRGRTGSRALRACRRIGPPDACGPASGMDLDFDKPHGRPSTSAVTEARPMAMADETASARGWCFRAPLVIGDRVTGVIVVSAPRRWSRTRRLPRLQQIADGRRRSHRTGAARRRGVAEPAGRRPRPWPPGDPGRSCGHPLCRGRSRPTRRSCGWARSSSRTSPTGSPFTSTTDQDS